MPNLTKKELGQAVTLGPSYIQYMGHFWGATAQQAKYHTIATAKFGTEN